VFVIGCLGDPASAAAVLFERHSLQGNSAPSRQKGQRLADTLTVGANQCSGFVGDFTEDKLPAAKCLTARGAGGGNLDPETANFVSCEVQKATHAFKVRGGCDGGGKGYLGSDEVAFTISTHQDQHIFSEATHEVAGTLMSHAKSGGWSNSIDHAAAGYMALTSTSAVRRLTPVECERLQGFPDDYTLTPHRNKPMADGPRYKALGNSMAVPVMHWIGKRIQMVENLK
jgi:DNA (cytosine-5)-methyltransferase 1